MATTNNLQKKYVSAIYDFDDDGGAISTIVPKTTSSVPQGSIINSIMFQTLTANTGPAGGTMQVTIGGVTIFGSALTLANRTTAETAPLVNLNAQDITTNTDPIKFALAAQTITGGKCRIVIGYFDPVA